MSKRNNEGDILVNKVNLALAKHQKALAAMLGSRPEEPSLEKLKAEEERAEMEDKASGYEQLGVGGSIPKEVADGSFTRRTVTSNDKLLQQLIGKKAARAHKASVQVPKTNVNAQKKPLKSAKQDESEDEEEGRAALFKSKRQKTASAPSPTDLSVPAEENASDESKASLSRNAERDDSDNTAKQKQRKAVSRPGSYLDEILNQRSKKNSNKKKKPNDSDNRNT